MYYVCNGGNFGFTYSFGYDNFYAKNFRSLTKKVIIVIRSNLENSAKVKYQSVTLKSD